MTKIIREVGFFRERNPSWPRPYPSIRDLVRPDAHPMEHLILSYLRTGLGHCVGAAKKRDVLVEKWQYLPEATGRILTDGEWAWPEELAYYVEKYHVALAEEFISWMANNKWRVPSTVDLTSLLIEGMKVIG
jgi:hypothetical protein